MRASLASPLPFDLDSADGLSLRGDVHLPTGEGRAPVVVLCHGFKGFKDWGFFPHLAGWLASRGFAAIRMNFAMNGIGRDPAVLSELDRFAANTVTRELDDLARVVEAVRKGGLPGAERMDRRRLGLLGHSRGGGIVLLKALADPGIRAVVTWACVGAFFEGADVEAWKRQGYLEVLNTRTRQVLRVGYAAWEDLQAHRAEYDVLARLPWLRARALFLHGSADASVPCGASERLASRLGDRGLLHLVKGADHAFGAGFPFQGPTPALAEAERVTADFLAEAL